MYLNQQLTARKAVAACVCLSGLLTLGGCSMFHHGAKVAEAAPSTEVAQSDTTTAPDTQTVTDAIADTDEDTGTTTVMRDAGPALKAGAPKDYVVKRGDTLWGIANMFLRDPWLWPEIWYVNPDIHNPHRIYPGDTLHLANGGDGRLALQVVHGSANATRLSPLLRSTDEDGPIPTIPYSIIGAFLSRPGVLSRAEIDAAPYVVALRDDHQVAGGGNDVYVKKLTGELGTRYSVMHVDEPLQDPQSHRRLGYMAIYTGTAQVSRPGEVARVNLVDSARETLQGDVLVAEASNPTSDFHPHVAPQPIDGRIIAVIDNVALAGQYEIVALNRGSADGLDRGTVLTVDSRHTEVADHCAAIEGKSTCLFAHSAELPIEKQATLLVFKTYEQMSYALILQDDYPIKMLDHVRNP
jgi:LysM repeat protein